jgi:hypothetical protein
MDEPHKVHPASVRAIFNRAGQISDLAHSFRRVGNLVLADELHAIAQGLLDSGENARQAYEVALADKTGV